MTQVNVCDRCKKVIGRDYSMYSIGLCKDDRKDIDLCPTCASLFNDFMIKKTSIKDIIKKITIRGL